MFESSAVMHLHNGAVPRTEHSGCSRKALSRRREQMSTALDELRRQSEVVDAAASIIVTALRSGNKVLVAGNGGSAAEAQHFSTELVGRFRKERAAYPVLALTADTAILTAVANDFGYEQVFARQVGAFGNQGDVFVAFSTSGESENLIRAARDARARGLSVIAMTGSRPCRLSALADVALAMPTDDTQLTQELHTVVLHVICDIIENSLCDGFAQDGAH
jgi:D-sedoheptulose 7-phosphate isomerase